MKRIQSILLIGLFFLLAGCYSGNKLRYAPSEEPHFLKRHMAHLRLPSECECTSPKPSKIGCNQPLAPCVVWVCIHYDWIPMEVNWEDCDCCSSRRDTKIKAPEILEAKLPSGKNDPLAP